MDFFKKYFEIDKRKSSVKIELIAGITTFLTMAYIIIVNANILSEAGMDKSALIVVTCLVTGLSTIAVGIVAKTPIAMAPGMGLNAFFAYSLVIGQKIDWPTALGIVFISGFVFLILTLIGVRERIVKAIPRAVLDAISVGIGLFIAFIGMQNMGLVVDSPATLVTLGDIKGHSRFHAVEVLDWSKLADKINGREGPVYIKVWNTLSEADREAAASGKPLSPASQDGVIRALNGILFSRNFFTPEDFDTVENNTEMKMLLDKGIENLTSHENSRLNRLMIEASFPGEIAQRHSLGHIINVTLLAGLIGLLVIVVLEGLKVKGSILIGIAVSTILGFIIKFTGMNPAAILISQKAASFSIAPIAMKLNIMAALKWSFVGAIFTLMFADMFDSIGTIVACSYEARLVEEDGTIKKLGAMLTLDAAATMFGAIMGTSTTTSYVESAAGIEAGGRTGLTSVFNGILFLLAIILLPVFTIVPVYATAPALVIVGMFMIKNITRIDFTDIENAFPAFITIVIMPLTYSISYGMAFGFISYVMIKVLRGKFSQVDWVLWVIAGLSALSLALH